MGIDDIIALPNQDHGIKECVLTFFLKSPIEDLDSFPDFFKSSLFKLLVFSKVKVCYGSSWEKCGNTRLRLINRYFFQLLFLLTKMSGEV